MSRRAISLDDVALAALALRNAGHPITTVNVRRQLGYGSYTTIGRYLHALGAREHGRPHVAETMPATVDAICRGYAQRTWQALQEHLRSRENEVTAPLRQKILDLTTKLAAVRELKERLTWEASELKRELERANGEVHALSAELAQAREDLAVERRLRQHDEAAIRAREPLRQPRSAQPAAHTHIAKAQVSIE